MSTTLRDKNQDKEIQRRITAGWTAFAQHRDIFKGNIGTCLKRQVYNSCILPAMTYGVETTFVFTTQAKNKLAGMEYAGHVSRIRDNRWTLRITTWKPCERKRPRGRLARHWRDELDDYWKSTIWQRTAQDRQMWKQHAEAFAQPQDTMAAQ